MAVCVKNFCLAEWADLYEKRSVEAAIPSGAQIVGANVLNDRVIVSVLSNRSAPSMTVHFRLVRTGEDIEGEDLRHVTSIMDIDHHLFIDVGPLRAAGMGIGTGHPDDQ